MTSFTESIVEVASLAWLEAPRCAVLHGPDIAVSMLGVERSDPNYRNVFPETLIYGELRVKDAEHQDEQAVRTWIRTSQKAPTRGIGTEVECGLASAAAPLSRHPSPGGSS